MQEPNPQWHQYQNKKQHFRQGKGGRGGLLEGQEKEKKKKKKKI